MAINNSVVAVLNDRDKIVGTGFLASENLIVTCAHVVVAADAIDGDTVQVRFDGQAEKLNAFVVPEYWRGADKDDVAILRLEIVPRGVTPLPMAPAAGSAGHDFHAYGYAIVTDVQGIGARGKIIDIVDHGHQVQLTSQEPDHGMSGGPVLDEQRGVVIGMVTKGKNQVDENKSLRNIYTTFATSTEVIFEVCQALKPTEICPYRSLDVFTEEYAPFFFGRGHVVTKLLESLKREPRFLAVLGPSGSGKSSVVRAGLIPALRQGKVPGAQKWEILTVRPANQPFEQLERVGLLNSQAGLENSVKDWLTEHPEKTRLILVIDQFEEALISTPATLRPKFIAELAQVLDSSAAITVVLTLRDDFYSRFLQDAARLAGWLERGLVNTPPVLEQDDLRAMIVGPAESIGLTFEDGLVDVIIADACETDRTKGLARSTILPLLEFALTQLWELRQDGRLIHAAYLKIGGTTGSLSQWADRIYYELSPSERKLTEEIFCELVHLGEEKEQVPDTRRVIPIAELTNLRKDGTVEPVIGKLVQARLLSVQREDETGQQSIEIIHDALLREWGLLGRWVDDFRHREQIARERRRRLTIFGLSFGLVLMIALAVFALFEWNSAVRQAQIALARQLVAQAESTIATRSSKQMIAVLLAVRSMQIVPSGEASRVLLNNKLARSKVHITMDGEVRSVAFSLDGKLAIAAGADTVLLLEVATGKELARIKFDDLVYSVVFSPDGKFMVAGCRDSTVLVWDVTNAREVFRRSQDGNVYSVVFSPDGNYIAASGEQVIRVWRADTGTEVTRIKINTGPVFSLEYSQDGKYLVSGDSKTARVWDVVTGKEIARKKHDDRVNAVAFSPDGKYVVSGSDDFTARVWEAETGTEISRVTFTGAVTSVAFSPDGKRVVSGSRDNIVRVWDAMTGGEIVRVSHDGSVFVAEFSPSGQSVVSGGSDNTVRIWDAKTGEESARMTHDGLVYAAAISPEGKYVISGSYDHTVRIWETFTSAEVARMTHNGRVYTVAFSPDGRYAVSGGSDNTARVWEVATQTELFRMLHDDFVYAAVFSKDGKYVASGGGHIVHLMEVATGKEIATMNQDASIFTVAFGPDGNYIASGGDDFTARVWDAKTGLEISRMEHTARVRSVAFSPDGKYVVSGSVDSTARVWDAMTGNEIACLNHDGEVYSASFSPDGKYIVSGDATTAHVWDIMTSKEIARVEQGNFVYSVAFSPDGKYIASGGARTSKVWEALTGKEIASLSHDGTVNAVAFSPDGQYVVSGDDKSARVWKAMTGKTVAEMSHNNLVKAVAFSPDGKFVISGGVDKTARVWLWQPNDLIANVCASLPRNLTRDEWDSYLSDQPYLKICPDLTDELEPRSTP